MIPSESFYQRVSIPPQRSRGLIIHTGIGLALIGAGSGLLWLASQAQDEMFIPYLVFGILFLLPLPLVLYRAISLARADYLLDRDGLRLRWGLRAVDIPLHEIEWIRQAEDLVIPLPLPFGSFTGFVRGVKQVEGMGRVEFLASDASRLLLVAAPDTVYVISPANIPLFMRHFQDALEMGSLSPVKARSVEPTSYFFRLWRDRSARTLIGLGGFFSLMLGGVVSLLIPLRPTVSIGFDANGAPAEPVRSTYLLLLPFLSIFFYIIDLLAGAFFYRRKDHRPIAYLVWASSLLTPILLGIAIIFIF